MRKQPILRPGACEMSQCDPHRVEQEFYNDSDSETAFNREQFVLKWLDSLPSIVDLVETFKKHREEDQESVCYHPSKAIKPERSAYSLQRSKINMSCPSRPSSAVSACPAKSKTICPAKAKATCPTKLRICPSMEEKLKHTCPAEAAKFSQYTCPSEIDQPKTCCCPKPKSVCPAKVEKPRCPIVTRKSSTKISRKKVRPADITRQNICPARQPNICPAEQPKVCPSWKTSVCPSQQENACPAKLKHVCPAKKNVCPSMQKNVYPGKSKQNICPGKFKQNICPFQQQQPPKVKKISKVKYSYETYKFPEMEQKVPVCPAAGSDLETSRCCCSRGGESNRYEEFSCGESETEPELDEYYKEHYEEVSYIDSDESPSCLAVDGYDEYGENLASSSEHSVCYQDDEPHRTCSCG